MNSGTPIFADASLFMGMHCKQESIRIACKNFFVSRLGSQIHMTLDQVGVCDDLVWRRSRRVQDLYYPFMDQLHTSMLAKRVPFSKSDVRMASEDPRVKHLDGSRALLLARVCNEGGVLYTLDPALLCRPNLPVRSVTPAPESEFQEGLESAYRTSLVLRFDFSELSFEEGRTCSAD